ncbi:MAG: hypothetical protein JJT94_08745 [Bernardetiaceae bacterium]|nr:hypothetical protein [Bernardetiaceae bacterium]
MTRLTAKLKILTLIGLLLLIAIFFLLYEDHGAEQSLVYTNVSFALEDTAAVTKLQLGEHLLERNNQNWILNGRYQADKQMLVSLFSVMQNLEVKKAASESIKTDLFAQFTQKGIPITIYQGAQKQKEFRIVTYKDASYAMTNNEEPYEVYIPGYYLPLGELFALNENEWRDKILLSTTPRTFKSLKLRYKETPSESFTILFDGEAFKIAELELAQTDTTMLYDYLPYYNRVRHEGFLDNPNLKDSLKQKEPIISLELRDIREANTRLIDFYASTDTLWGIIKQTDELVKLNPKIMNQLFVPRSLFHKKQK